MEILISGQAFGPSLQTQHLFILAKNLPPRPCASSGVPPVCETLDPGRLLSHPYLVDARRCKECLCLGETALPYV